MDKGYIVTKSNKLIGANYDLTLQEQKIILTLASMVQPNDTDFKEYEFKIKDFIKLLGLKDQSKYTELPKITRELKKKVFDIREGTDIIQASWLGGVRYKTKEGVLILSLDKGLKPYMLELKEFYTSYKLENILTMKSKYSIRLYEILKSNQFKQTWEVDLENFKKLIGATENSYSIYQNVKNRILLKSKDEINVKTDIRFEFEEVKTGRKVTSIKFYIHSNKTKKVNAPKSTVADEVSVPKIKEHEETPLDTLEQRISQTLEILENKVSPSEALSIIGSIDGDMAILKKAYEYCKDKQTDNFVGYIIKIAKSIKDGSFNEPKKSYKKTGFNNFEPRKQSKRYIYLQEQCLLGQATDEEKKEFDKMRGVE